MFLNLMITHKMSRSKNDYDDLKIVISRVDEICNFLNNMKKTSKTTKERLDLLESSYKKLEQNNNIMQSQLTKRLKNVETTVAENKEKMKTFEEGVKERNNDSIKEKELNKQYINANIKEGINDLEKRIANLDIEYKAIQCDMETKMTNLAETNEKVEELESKLVSMKRESIHRSPTTFLQCKVCEHKFVSRNDLTHHLKTKHHTDSLECEQCERRFLNASHLEKHIQEHGTSKKYECVQCCKTFHLRWRLSKHIRMHDSPSQIRKCHFYNNGKQCPFEDIGCKFLHEESLVCKYGDKCQYDKCQFRH